MNIPDIVMPPQQHEAERWYPATGLQRAMILSSLKSEARGVYQQQLVVRLREGIASVLFRRALDFVLKRPDALGLRFAFRDGGLWQTLADTADMSIREIGPGKGSPNDQLHEFLARDRREPFPLLDGKPPWRSALLRFGEADFAWVWTHHHALCDGASYGPLLLEIFATYDRLQACDNLITAVNAPDFFDYLRWLEASATDSSKLKWQARLKTRDTPSALPEIRGAVSWRRLVRSKA